MNNITIRKLENYRGNSVILIGTNRAGLTELLLSITKLEKYPESNFIEGNTRYEFSVTTTSKIELFSNIAILRFTVEVWNEIMDKLSALNLCKTPCHHYVDVEDFEETIVLSVDEEYGEL